jgi:hypothetical protein
MFVVLLDNGVSKQLTGFHDMHNNKNGNVQQQVGPSLCSNKQVGCSATMMVVMSAPRHTM